MRVRHVFPPKGPQWIDVADQHHFHFDTVQMPLNVMDAHYDSFEQQVLPIAISHNTAVFGMKTFGDAFIFKSGVCTPMELLHYAISLPTTLQVLGIDSLGILKQSLDAVKTYAPLTADQRAAILAKSAQVAANGRTEKYKTTHHFDGTINHPQWLG